MTKAFFLPDGSIPLGCVTGVFWFPEFPDCWTIGYTN